MQFETVFETRSEGSVSRQTGYGDLEKILAFSVPAVPFFGTLRGKTVLLALVRPWDTDGKDASQENVFFKSRNAKIVMDIRSLVAVVGLVETRRRWGIIDRTPEIARITFADDSMVGAEQGDVGDGLEDTDIIL